MNETRLVCSNEIKSSKDTVSLALEFAQVHKVTPYVCIRDHGTLRVGVN